MATDDYFKRQVLNQKYGDGADSDSLNLTYEQRLSLKAIQTHYPTKDTPKPAKVNEHSSSHDHSQKITKEEMLVNGLIILGIASPFFAILELMKFTETRAYRKMTAGEVEIFIFSIVVLIISGLVLLQTRLSGYPEDKSPLYKKNHETVFTTMFVVAIFFVGLFTFFIANS